MLNQVARKTGLHPEFAADLPTENGMIPFQRGKFQSPGHQRWQVKSAGFLLSCLLIGCGGGNSTPPAAPAPANTPAAATVPAPAASAPAVASSNAVPNTAASPAATSSATGTSVDPNHKETKWIGTIPYDVFYDQPLSIATDTTMVTTPGAAAIASAGVSTATSPAAMAPAPGAENPGNSPSSANSASSAGGSVNWADILPMPMLVEEVKSLRTNLTGNLQTVATFNKAQKPIALDGAMLTAMAVVAGIHPETVTWKPNAHFVRDLAFAINANSTGTGREPYLKTKDPFDKILVILDGGKPPEMESPETVPFSESVYVADMMKRIEQSFNNLKANINTEARLKEKPAEVERELRILLTLSTMMTDSSYDNADQPAYQAFLKRFTDGSRAGVMAVQTGSLEGFQAALNQLQTTCAECHQQYKGSESGF